MCQSSWLQVELVQVDLDQVDLVHTLAYVLASLNMYTCNSFGMLCTYMNLLQ
jgi:hypothetical protein